MANKKLKNRLFQQKFDYEEPNHISDEWDQVSGLIDIGYAAIERKNYPVMTENWLRAWEIVMRMVKNSNAPMKLSISALDEATDYEYNLQAWLQDMEMELYNAGEHEKRIWFCEEILSLLDWEYDDDGGFKMAIGESLYALGRTEEGETYFTNWLEKEPGDVDALNGYSIGLSLNKEYEKAYHMLKNAIGDDSCTFDNDVLYVRLIELTEKLGLMEEKKAYQEKYEQFKKKVDAMAESFGDEFLFDDFIPNTNSPVVKSAKIYPNDPCPCGSGKKYKKCCGKN